MPIPAPEPGLTHTVPLDPTRAVGVPAPAKRHLGFDDSGSWIIVNEDNEFDWPGYDLRKLGRGDRYDYGFLPPRFFNQIRGAFTARHRTSKADLTQVTETRSNAEPAQNIREIVRRHRISSIYTVVATLQWSIFACL